MEQVYIDIMNSWTEYTGYNDEQKNFSIKLDGISDYDIHKITKKAVHIHDEYDDTGILSIIIIKQFFLKMIKENKICIYDLLQNSDILKPHKKIFEKFMCKSVCLAESEYLSAMFRMGERITGVPLLDGSGDSQKILAKIIRYTDDVIDGIDKCKVEFYQNGGTIGNIVKISSSIHIFTSLAECILALCNAEDGMYLCYIDIEQSADSYFGFFIKSNGNIFSVNERINESYRGQHKNMRNGNWTRSKADKMFPYDFIFSYGEYDYKGYSNKYMIDEEKLSSMKMDEDAYFPLLIAMMLLSKKI